MAWAFAIAAAAGALWALAPRREPPAAPLDEIDAASRSKLERVLREADAEPAR